jgi:hypothetical protein
MGRQNAHLRSRGNPARGSHCKLEFDTKLRAFTLAKPLLAGLTYPYDWGFIPSTKAEDGDPLDVLVIHDAGTYPGLALRCRPIGVLEVLQASNGKKETTESLRYQTAHLLRAIYRMCGICLHEPFKSWKNSLKRPMHWKIKNFNSWDGAVRRMRSRSLSDFLNSILKRNRTWEPLMR